MVEGDMSQWGDDDARLEYFRQVEEALHRALAAGQQTIALTMPVVGWLNVLDEVKDRHLRNYSRLLSDDTIERLNAAIDRVHEEANYLAAFSPGLVADRFDDRQPRSGRQMASPELQRQMRERDRRPRDG